MKIRILLIVTIMVIGALTEIGYCQPPPPPGGGHGSGNNEPPAGAPIGEGLTILITLGAAYASKKIYNIRNEKKEN